MSSRDSSDGKQQISFNLSERLLAGLRRKAEEKSVTLNEALRNILHDYFFWYQLPEPVIEVLRADAKKKGEAMPRDYIVDLLMNRFTEIKVEQHQTEKKK